MTIIQRHCQMPYWEVQQVLNTSVIDIRCAYYQIEVTEESKKYTAFRFENALFE